MEMFNVTQRKGPSQLKLILYYGHNNNTYTSNKSGKGKALKAVVNT